MSTFTGPIVPANNPGEARLSPAITATYWRPFTAYVIVLDETGAATTVSHRIFPVSASKARNRRFRSPKKITSPAVARTAPFVGTFPNVQRWTSPVDMFTLASPFRLFGYAPGRGVPTRRSAV